MSKDVKPKPTARVPENQPLTPQEEEVLSTLRSTYAGRLSGISENTLIRYIRGYKDDAHPKEKAVEMLGKMLKWRQERGVDAIVKETLPKADTFHRIWPSGLHGHGKDGHPVLINRVGQVDGSKLTKEFSMDDVTKFHIQEMESLDAAKDEATRRKGHRIYKHIAVLDLKGLSMGHLRDRFTEPMQQFIHIDQDYYPETLHVMIIVNANMLVKTAWKIASRWIDPITKERIRFGNEALLEFMDAGNIPKLYGGHCGCAGGRCLEVPFVEGDKTAAVAIAQDKHSDTVNTLE